MTDSKNSERSLLDEIEELNVIESEQLQEGVAFHAFRFHYASPMEALVLSVKGALGPAAAGLQLPQGAIVMDAEDGQIRILFDPNQVPVHELEELAFNHLGGDLTNLHHDTDKYTLTPA